MLNVDPPNYYPIINKLFAARLAEALEALGIQLDSIEVRVVPEGRTLRLIFKLVISGMEGFVPIDVQETVQGILEKLADDATTTFGRLYSVRFEVEDFELVRAPQRNGWEANVKLIVNGPDEKLERLNRLGRGLVITLKEWGIAISALTVSMPLNGPGSLRIVIKAEAELSEAEKNELAERVRTKACSFMKTLFGSACPVQVRIIDPKDRTMKIVLREEERLEALVKELSNDEDIKRLLSLLGKSPPGL
ncbi:hypothetical protein A3L08_07275 [Thermococcus pacificus]|uniref:Uncharacterized protein n=1 Tax=Thermococcus pacificus TaxID=71998 RepID=A0A218P8M5_9EURY|nr:hypothetical protein A3L08_07275 [Thermococcus pacificus]